MFWEYLKRVREYESLMFVMKITTCWKQLIVRVWRLFVLFTACLVCFEILCAVYLWNCCCLYFWFLFLCRLFILKYRYLTHFSFAHFLWKLWLSLIFLFLILLLLNNFLMFLQLSLTITFSIIMLFSKANKKKT